MDYCEVIREELIKLREIKSLKAELADYKTAFTRLVNEVNSLKDEKQSLKNELVIEERYSKAVKRDFDNLFNENIRLEALLVKYTGFDSSLL